MTLTVTPVVVFSPAPSVQLTVSSSPSVAGLLKVWRTHEDGSRHRVLTDSAATLVGSWVGVDHHPKFNDQLTYTAECEGQTSAVSAPVYALSDVMWLLHPTDPALSFPVEFPLPFGDYTYEDRAQESLVLNSRLPRLRADRPLGGQSGTMTFLCESAADVVAVRELRASGGALLLNDPNPEIGFMWIHAGPLTERNPSPRRGNPSRIISFTYREVAQPDADVRIRTLDELRADFPTATLNDLNVTYASLNDLKLDIRQP